MSIEEGGVGARCFFAMTEFTGRSYTVCIDSSLEGGETLLICFGSHCTDISLRYSRGGYLLTYVSLLEEGVNMFLTSNFSNFLGRIRLRNSLSLSYI